MDKDIIITCEHAGNEVPEHYRDLFINNPEVLKTHRGYDIGALELTQTCAAKLQVTPHVHSVTRLLVDLNRSLNSSELFSEFVESLDEGKRRSVVEEYYQPHRNTIEQKIAEGVSQGRQILHLSVHTFTPKLNGTRRDADIGLLFDPDRPSEKRFCTIWKSKLEQISDLKVRFNYPYPGEMDGFSTYLRTQFSDEEYVGLEVEVNQKFPESENINQWNRVREIVGDTLLSTYEGWCQE